MSVTDNQNKNKGQALVEYIMLLAVITVLSFVLLKAVNSNLADLWTRSVNSVIGTTGGQVQLAE